MYQFLSAFNKRLLIAAAVALPSMSALAQQAPSAAAEPLQEIIVTAQKRSQPLDEVGISVTDRAPQPGRYRERRLVAEDMQRAQPIPSLAKRCRADCSAGASMPSAAWVQDMNAL